MLWLMMTVALGAVAAETGAPPSQRLRSVTLAAGQTCPAAAPGEVVVCRPLEDPYRIPKPLRRSAIAAATTSWVNRAAVIDDVGRTAAGLPDTCSVVGTGGQTGCNTAFLRQWAAERKALARGEQP